MSTRCARISRFTLAAASVAVLPLFAACGAGPVQEDVSVLERARQAGAITVGFAGEAPYSFEQGGVLTGATVALHEEIFSRLGIARLDGVNTDFGALIPGLNAGRFDAVSAGMSILPQRCAQAAFSEPEFLYTTALMVPAGNPHGLTDMQSIKDAGVRLAVMTGAIESDYAAALEIDTIQVAGPQNGMDAVVTGRADVFALTGISLTWMANNNPGAPVEVTDSFVAVIDGVEQVGAGGTVFRLEDADLLAAYNAELATIVTDPERYLSIVGPFGFTEAERPKGDLTTAELCEGVG